MCLCGWGGVGFLGWDGWVGVRVRVWVWVWVCRYGRSKMDEVFRQDAKEREITLSDFLLQV